MTPLCVSYFRSKFAACIANFIYLQLCTVHEGKRGCKLEFIFKLHNVSSCKRGSIIPSLSIVRQEFVALTTRCLFLKWNLRLVWFRRVVTRRVYFLARVMVLLLLYERSVMALPSTACPTGGGKDWGLRTAGGEEFYYNIYYRANSRVLIASRTALNSALNLSTNKYTIKRITATSLKALKLLKNDTLSLPS